MKKEREKDLDFLTDSDENKLELSNKIEEVEKVDNTDVKVEFDKIVESLNKETENKIESKKKRGRPKKTEMREEQQADNEENKFLVASVSLSIVSVTSLVSQLFGDKWKAEQEEANFLAESIIIYLDTRFPNWKKTSPELNLIVALSSYFIKRLV